MWIPICWLLYNKDTVVASMEILHWNYTALDVILLLFEINSKNQKLVFVTFRRNFKNACSTDNVEYKKMLIYDLK